MVQGLGAPAGPTTLAELLVRPGLPGAASTAVAPEARTQRPPDQVSVSVEARQRAAAAKQTVATLEADGAWSSAAAFGWLLHQRMLVLLSAGGGRASGAAPADESSSAPPAPATPSVPRGGAIDLAA